VTFLLPMLPVCSLVIAILLNVPSTARAEFYKYKDSSGALVITNKLEDVPKKYRKNMKVVWDEELTAKDPLARRAAAAEARREQQQREQAQQQQEKQGQAKKLQSSDGKKLVIRIDEETGEVSRTME
jgi:hypothetical protein